MDKIIFFTALVLFPFGQLFKIGIFNLFDGAVLLLAIVTILKKPVYPSWYKYFIYFVLFCFFSLALNYSLFTVHGSLYLLRFVSYSFVAIYISNYFKKQIIISYLLILSCTAAVFGWFQYFLYPDLTSLKYLGWDDHLLRMVGTFLDPTYLGLILVLGIILASNRFPKIMYFLFSSLAFTYSRASYLIAILFLIYKKKFLALFIFTLILFLIPKNIGEGTTLTRTVSANNKLINYSQTFEIFKKSPLFGVGFNNMCSARQKYLGDTNPDFHSCSGADSSVLFLLATTGIIGTMMFVNMVYRIWYIGSPQHTKYNILYTTSFIAVLIHSLFANSLFYPHIMFWLFVLIGLGSKVDSQ